MSKRFRQFMPEPSCYAIASFIKLGNSQKINLSGVHPVRHDASMKRWKMELTLAQMRVLVPKRVQVQILSLVPVPVQKWGPVPKLALNLNCSYLKMMNSLMKESCNWTIQQVWSCVYHWELTK
jgi:hypothetical protein